MYTLFKIYKYDSIILVQYQDIGIYDNTVTNITTGLFNLQLFINQMINHADYEAQYSANKEA